MHCKRALWVQVRVSSIDCQNLTISNYWPIAAPQKYNSFGYGPTENAITEHHNFPEKISKCSKYAFVSFSYNNWDENRCFNLLSLIYGYAEYIVSVYVCKSGNDNLIKHRN